MKKIIFITFSLLLILSCKDRALKETRLLMETLVREEVNNIVDTVLISNQAANDWIERAGLDSCALGELITNNNLGLGLIKSENFEADFLTESDYEKLCRESMVDFIFSSDDFPKDVSVVSYLYIQKLFEEFKVNGQTPEIGKVAWYSFSKPVFFQGYKYAFIYYERFTIMAPMVGGSTSLLFYEKGEDEKWKLILSKTLIFA